MPKASSSSKKTSTKSTKTTKARSTSSPKTVDQPYFRGTGRRKNAIATVKLYNTPAAGEITVNDKTVEDAIKVEAWIKDALSPLEVSGLKGNVTIVARTYGGGIHGQAGALSLGIARAINLMDPEQRPVLKSNGLLTRDSRMRESKKYGLKRARKAPQYTKR